MHTSTASSGSSPERRGLRKVIDKIFGRGGVGDARVFLDGATEQVGLRATLLIAAIVKAFSGTSAQFFKNLSTLRKLRYRAVFLGEQHSVRLDGNGGCVLEVQPKDLDIGVNAFYIAALKKLYSALKAIRIDLSFEKSDLFDALSTKIKLDDSQRLKERGELLATAHKMLLVSAMIRKSPEICLKIILSKRLISSRRFHLEELSGFVDGVYKELHVSSKEVASFNSVFVQRTLHKIKNSPVPTTLILGGGKGAVVVVNRVVDETVQLMMEWIEALASYYKPNQKQYSAELLFNSCSGNDTLLSLLSVDSVRIATSGLGGNYELRYVLNCLAELGGSGARLACAVDFAARASEHIESEGTLGLLSVYYSLRTFGEEYTLRAVKLSDRLLNFGKNERFAFAQGLEAANLEISIPFSVPSIHLAIRVLEELGISEDHARYLNLASLAARMGSLEPVRIKMILSSAMDLRFSLDDFVAVMLPIWRMRDIALHPSALVEQIEGYGYRQLLVDWVGSEPIVELSYAAIGQNFSASYRHTIQRLKEGNVAESTWLSVLHREFVMAFTAAYVQGRFADGELKLRAQQFIGSTLKIDSPPYEVEPGDALGLDYTRCYSESVEIIFRALSLYFGQGALMVAAKRSAPDRATQIEDFARHCCNEHTLVRGRGDLFPGSGVWMKGLDIKRFIPAANIRHGLADALPQISRVQRFLGNSSVFYLRGCRMVLPPDTDDFRIFGKVSALISFQDHFGDPQRNGVVIVSRDAAVNICESICRGAFSPKDSSEILKRCEAISGTALQISSISCLGGLCNALPVGLPPLWGWEVHNSGSGLTRDFSGHLHKFYNTWDSGGLAPFAAAHDRIYRVATNLFDIEIAWRIGMQRYQLGHFYGTKSGEDIYSDALFWGERFFPKFGYRALIAAMRWHFDLNSAGESERSKYPVLVIANPTDHWNTPSTDVYLDTYDMVLSGGRDRHKFSVPTDLSGASELEIASRIPDMDKLAWRLMLWEPAESRGAEFRFEHRNRLRGLSS